MAERVSIADKTLFRSYANHIQRYQFAGPYCAGGGVLDAGCGTGYGSYYLATHGAGSVVGVDISDEALDEARRLYRGDTLRFLKGDVERLTEVPELGGPFGAVVNLENIEHLHDAPRFVAEARRVLSDDGALVVSSPNVTRSLTGEDGKPCNPFHIKEYSIDEFRELLGGSFGSVEMFGQWDTPERKARLDFEWRIHEALCATYYGPGARLWRGVRKLMGKPCAPPPVYTGGETGFSWEFSIHPIGQHPFPWEPDTILAVCRP
jgi:SAM-dependent methyltransferase